MHSLGESPRATLVQALVFCVDEFVQVSGVGVLSLDGTAEFRL